MGYSKVPIGGRYNLRRYRRKVSKLGLNVKNLIFPIPPKSLAWLMIVMTVMHLVGASPFHNTISKADGVFAAFIGQSIYSTCLAIALISFCVWYAVVQTIRWSFTLMLYYKGWLFETVGKPPSLATKIFMTIIKLVNKNARFFSFQDLTPWLLVPSLKATLQRYLRSVRPLLNDEEYEEYVKLAGEFETTVGPSLQKKLWLKWLTSRNYLSDWWKEVVYMRYRGSLINTNVGCADVIYQKTTDIQAARAATVALCRQHFFREINTKQTMKPITLGGIPLCSSQYIDYYRTVRMPCETSDKMVRLEDARHIAVYCKGCWYKLNIFHGRRLLRPAELERSLQAIIDRTPDPCVGEKYMSALTAGDRELWAKIRREQFSTGINRASISMIDNALEVIFLDDEDRFFDVNDPTKYDYEYARTLHGNGYQLWCDKPSVFCFSKNGRFTSNGEHSVVDALIFVHVREYVKYHEAFTFGYGPDGHAKGEIEVVPTAERLQWDLNQEVQTAIDDSYKLAKSVADDFSNASCILTDFGKNFMKKIGVSPDAFIQMAMQMAYYKDQGKFELTYEPTMMRLFKDGRTETVRSCSIESCDFVRSMLDKEATDERRLELFKIACDYHQNLYRHAMAGHGCDRHLFALYIVSKYLEMKSPFLDKVFGMSYALSTSQTPQHQQTELMSTLNKSSDLFWPAGAFCCPEGSNYGVCYTIGATGDAMSFHVSTWKSLKNTDATRFRNEIEFCLRSLKDMCERSLLNKK